MTKRHVYRGGRHWMAIALLGLALLQVSCVTKRTVTAGGETLEEKYVIKRPVKTVLDSIEME